ncbi:citrate:proton symporter, partial [Streptomyces sp. PU-14G]|uniref:citrate:proton symporter n=1 Tax=Streptomyces sp. PU-14G TaxID=2800808 RepID=UPI0034DFCA92
MLTLLGFAMIAVFLVLIMTKKMSPIAALVLIPALFCVLVGQGADLGGYVLDGIGDLAPTAAMLMFAIIYFGVMIDVGLFDPIVRGILRFCKADPMRIVVGTAVLAAIVSLDGDGSTTFMITVSAMLPLYRRLGMSVVVMTGVAATANGVMNTLPWGGPTARAATALHLDAGDIFVPMVPALAVGMVCVLALAYVLGVRERRRLGTLSLDGPGERAAARAMAGPETAGPEAAAPEAAGETDTTLVGAGAGAGACASAAAAAGAGGGARARVSLRKGGAPAAGGGSAVGGRAVAVGGNVAPGGGSVAPGGPDGDAASGAAGAESAVLDPDRACLRPRLYWFNAALTVALLVLLIAQLLPIPVLFLLGAALALTVNFRDMADQKARIAAHAENVLNVSGMVFA